MLKVLSVPKITTVRLKLLRHSESDWENERRAVKRKKNRKEKCVEDKEKYVAFFFLLEKT
jgi:hypothetical protein